MLPGNELGMMVEASILGTQGRLEGIQADHKLVSHVNALGDKCKRSSSVVLQVVAGILLSLTESNLMQAK